MNVKKSQKDQEINKEKEEEKELTAKCDCGDFYEGFEGWGYKYEAYCLK